MVANILVRGGANPVGGVFSEKLVDKILALFTDLNLRLVEEQRS
jgi:hypothetical protein